MTKPAGNISLFNVWHTPKNACWQVLRCDEKHYIFRQRYSQESVEIEKGKSLDEFQLALFNVSTNGDNSTYRAFNEKIEYFDPEEVDYSYLYMYTAMRDDFYNYKMASYNGDGKLLYGTKPNWVNGQCRDVVLGVWGVNAPDGIVYQGSDMSIFCPDENTISIEFDTDEDFIYEGEDYYAMPKVTSTAGSITSLEIVYQSDFDWLETGSPADYWKNNYDVDGSAIAARYANRFYVRSKNNFVRQRNNMDVGTYTYKLKAKDDHDNVKYVTRTIKILDGSLHSAANGNGIAVLTGDEFWFSKTQLDIASGVERFADNSRFPLKKGYHYDYYGTLPSNVKKYEGKFNNWYSDKGISQIVYDCGENRFKIEYLFVGHPEWSVDFNQSLFDVKTGIVLNSNVRKEYDYSLAPFVQDGLVFLNGRKYNPNVPLVDDKGNVLWGIPPTWSSSCKDVVAVLPDQSKNGSRNEKMLTVKFRDMEPAHTQGGDFNFLIDNKGNNSVDVSDYELRFYYGSKQFDPAVIEFKNAGSQSFESKTARCNDEWRVLKVKLGKNVTIKAKSKFPEDENGLRFEARLADYRLVLNKFDMYSWMNVDSWTDNIMVGLFDSNGEWVYGLVPDCVGTSTGGDSGESSEGETGGGPSAGEQKESRNLSVQFVDAAVSNNYQGEFNFRVLNKGEDDISIAGYEMWFYYGGNQKFDASLLQFYGNVNDYVVSTAKCAENQYVFKVKFKDGSVAKAGKSYPEYNNIFFSVQSNPWGGIDKSAMYSWTNSSSLLDNEKMTLFDEKHQWVFGEKKYTCGSGDAGIENVSDEYKYASLTAQFQDKIPSDKKKGDFKFGIANSGNKDVAIGGYEMRFYYSTDKKFNASDFKIEKTSSDNASITLEKCYDDHYMIRIKLEEGAFVKGNSIYPMYYPIGLEASMSNGLDLIKSSLYSWIGGGSMKTNFKVTLYDENGYLIHGTPYFDCSNAVTIVPSGTTTNQNASNLKFSVEETESLKSYVYTENDEEVSISDGLAQINLLVKNIGDVDAEGPLYVNYYVSHPDGQIPVLTSGNIELSKADEEVDLGGGISVKRYTLANKHTYQFILKDGIKSGDNRSIDFTLHDDCVECVDKSEAEFYFRWNVLDDWSHAPSWDSKKATGSGTVETVVILSKNYSWLYGNPDMTAPQYKLYIGDGNGPIIPIPGIDVQEQFTNRTDAIDYQGGQLLVNGSFDEPSFVGWNLVLGSATSVRGEAAQGSRYLDLYGGVRQELSDNALEYVNGNDVILSFKHKASEDAIEKGENCHISVNHGGGYTEVGCSPEWKTEIVKVDGSLFTESNRSVTIFSMYGHNAIDDVTLKPAAYNDAPSLYAVRFTTTQHEEIESRVYDGDDKLVVTTSKRDEMGRTQYKYLPFELKCQEVESCNSEEKTLNYTEMASEFYTLNNPLYPDAGGYPYVETSWKPDAAVTKDVEGAPGKAFSIEEGHLVRSYSSGVNLSGVNMKNMNSLATAVNAVRNRRVYDGKINYHALAHENPSHMWELTIDQNDNAAFIIKDGEGNIVVSGSMVKQNGPRGDGVEYVVASYSYNELDSRGRVLKAHSPLSCEYVPSPGSCVNPSTYTYDVEGHMIYSNEPDAGETRFYYDLAGRLRATQTQNQFKFAEIRDKKKNEGFISPNQDEEDLFAYELTVIEYDDFDRQIITGRCLTNENENQLRIGFKSVAGVADCEGSKLVDGSITRFIYDEIPTQRSILGVDLYPNSVNPSQVFKYSRGRLVSTISDIGFDKDNNVMRVSFTNAYDKYGRIIASYSYDPTMPDDSLKMMAVKNTYDVGGKLTSSEKYPYGLNIYAKNRAVSDQYVYDRLGRISSISVKNGASLSTELVSYAYYPTGNVKTVRLGNNVTIDYTYHISGAVKTATAKNADGKKLFEEELYYEDCGNHNCVPQYNGNISYMVHELAANGEQKRSSKYVYDFMNRLTSVEDSEQDMFNEYFKYDEQGRIVSQRRGQGRGGDGATGGEYGYYANTNRLEKVSGGMGGMSAANRDMSASENFVYDAEGNLIEDKSKNLKISYDWRGMPVEFRMESKSGNVLENTRGCSRDSVRVLMAYDGTGRRVSKTRERKACLSETSSGATSERTYAADWERELVTHYTGIGTEVRESFHNGTPSETKVVVNMPQGLGRYGVEDATDPFYGVDKMQLAGYIPSAKFEWFLKNHLGSTMLVYGTSAYNDTYFSGYKGGVQAAYDYRAFGEQVTLSEPTEKVTENFTGKEKDDETELNYFGARYLDPMIGLWISVDPARQFSSPYLYAGNGVNPVNVIDPDGNKVFYHPSVQSNQNFKNEFSTAIQYLNKGGVSGTFAWLQKRPEKIYIAKAANGEGSTIDYDDYMKAIVINWNPNEALVFPEGTQSPALGVLHEGIHAKGFLKNPSLYMKRLLENDDQYDNKEERRVIEGPESWAAEKLGESIRFNHGGEPVYVEHSDELPE
ncbi:RHS repeat domain-containing protein [Fibrobacter sp. UWH1]|uniref:RHS repeat domain-containing protein n=1 Tax=Fibrobacter sp. UWH1 TaxID=1964354 RepID=UPI00159588B9|nr:RHS repeat-associated core domain-containing protein [Fibrobacter sp. UWH1]